MYITVFIQKIIETVIYFDTVLKQTDKYVITSVRARDTYIYSDNWYKSSHNVTQVLMSHNSSHN